MITLIKNARLYAPQDMGKKDVMVAGGKILAIGDSLDVSVHGDVETEVVDAGNHMLIPGLVDSHVHIAGAGGEGGPASRTPEINIRDLIEGGVTTVVGCLGTDGITRDVRSVLMKAKALREEGLSAWIYTGAYQVPPPTITGDYARDIALVDEVIGVGEIALSDHRSSNPSVKELIRLASHARIAGMLSGKAGILNIHMGDAPNPFQPILKAVEKSELPFSQFYPTHCNRNTNIFGDAKQYGKKGFVDLTSSSYPCFPDVEVKPSRAVTELLKAGVPIDHITLSSDANGSLPSFDDAGNLVRLERGKPESNLNELRDMILEEKIDPQRAVKTLSSNPAEILGIKRKGKIETGYDADLLLLDEDFHIIHMMAGGRWMTKDRVIVHKPLYRE